MWIGGRDAGVKASVWQVRFSGGDMSVLKRTHQQQTQTPETRPGGITGKGFLPGRSGNPGGRPTGLAEKVRKETKDGSLIIKLMIAVAEGKKIGDQKPKIQDRLDAARWLADRGWGKPVQAMEHLGPGGILKQSEVHIYIPDNKRDHGSAT